jgi:hypothetical protein
VKKRKNDDELEVRWLGVLTMSFALEENEPFAADGLANRIDLQQAHSAQDSFSYKAVSFDSSTHPTTNL